MPTMQCMKPSDISSHELLKKDAYDCQKLIAEYSSYAQLSHDEKNLAFDDALKEWSTVRNAYYLPGQIEYVQTHNAEQEALSDNLAALVCHGVNPNRVAVQHVSRSHGYGMYPPYEKRDYLCALDYAIDTDNTRLASFLLRHNAWPHTHLLTRFASIKDFFFGEPPQYSWTITRATRDHILLKIRSTVMAEIVVPHTGVACTFAEKKTIVHHIAEKNDFSVELLNYYANFDETLFDKPDRYGNTPLHRLAETCEYANYYPDVREKTTVFAQKTKNINAVNAQGQTALDIAALSKCNCERFIQILKAHGGKPASALQNNNVKQKFEYGSFEFDEYGRE
jgi:hypothetical protein